MKHRVMICLVGVFGLLCLSGKALGAEVTGDFPDLTPYLVTPPPGPEEAVVVAEKAPPAPEKGGKSMRERAG